MPNPSTNRSEKLSWTCPNCFGLVSNVLDIGQRAKFSTEKLFWTCPHQFGQVRQKYYQFLPQN